MSNQPFDNNDSNLIDDIQTNTIKPNLFYCLLCPDLGAFNQKWKLNKHTKNKHPNDTNELVCGHCDKSFKYKQSKQKHEISCPVLKEKLWKPKEIIDESISNTKSGLFENETNTTPEF